LRSSSIVGNPEAGRCVSSKTIRIRLGYESVDVTLAYLEGKDAESERSAGTCEQQQPGAVRRKNSYTIVNTTGPIRDPATGACIGGTTAGSNSIDTKTHLGLLRVGSDGSSSVIGVKDWEADFSNSYSSTTTDCVTYTGTAQAAASGPLPNLTVATPITNSNTGILLSWQADLQCAYCSYANLQSPPPRTVFGLANTSNNSPSATTVNIPGQASPIVPLLQAQDGSFFGTVGTGPQPGQITQTNMIAFDGSGHTKWSVPNDTPKIATADGGVIGASGAQYDSNGT